MDVVSKTSLSQQQPENYRLWTLLMFPFQRGVVRNQKKNGGLEDLISFLKRVMFNVHVSLHVDFSLVFGPRKNEQDLPMGTVDTS